MAKTMTEVQTAARARWVRIARIRAEGRTLQQIADMEGLSRERVRQIVSQGERYLRQQAAEADGKK